MQAKNESCTHHGVMWLLCLTFALALSGCATTGLAPGEDAAGDPVQQAEELRNSGDQLGAAQLYQRLARRADGGERDEYALRATEAYLAARRIPQAKEMLAQVGESKDKTLTARVLLARADIALAEDQPQYALSALVVTGDFPKDLRARLHKTRAVAYEQSGDLLAAAGERTLLDGLLSDDKARRDNRLAIWNLVSGLPDTTLQQSAGAQPEALGGWMELALITKAARHDPDELRGRLSGWLDRHAKHPAAGDVLTQLMEQRPTLTHGYPAQVALLLPLQGRFSNEAQAIRNGFLAAYYARRFGGTPPLLRIYDTGEGADQVRVQYDRAVREGAGLVIGPLTKSATTALAKSGPLNVPVLALNYTEDDTAPPEFFFQFGLSPEDEARQAAERATLDGRTRALALSLQGDWGNRMLIAFKQRFEELGGQVVEYMNIPSSVGNLSGPIRQLLRSDGSGARRQDADFLFLAVLPEQARSIRPQLLYNQAGDLPIYATSHVFAGTRTTSSDLDGILFCDMPWLLNPALTFNQERQRLTQLWPQSLAANQRLYALGIDAYNIIPYLAQLRGSNTQGYNGASGRLYVDEQGRLHRQLLWGRFSGGTTHLVGDSPPPAP